MKFRCESCGKRFASVDEPFPGRVYKIRCSRCGQLVTVQAPVPWEEPGAPARHEAPAEVEVAAAARAAPPPPLPPPPAAPATLGRLAPRPADETEEIPIDLALSDEYPLLRRRRKKRAAWTVIAATSAVGLALGVVGIASLRTGAEAEVPAVAVAPPPPAERRTPELGSVQLPVPAPPPASAFAGAPPAPAPSAAAPAPGVARAPVVPPARAPATPGASVPRAAPRAKVAFEGDGARPVASPPPAPEKVDPGLAAALLRKEDAAVRAGLPDPAELLAVLEGRRAALEACFDYAATTAGGAAWKGRAPQLVVRVQGTGRATASVDDAALEPTEIAACLRRTIARTRFPAFTGEPVELRTAVAIPGE